MNLFVEHALELQVVQTVLLQSHFCDVLAQLIAAEHAAGHDEDNDAAHIMTGIVGAINGPENLFFLQTDVNSAKRTYVQKAVASNAAAPALSVASTPTNSQAFADVHQFIHNAAIQQASTDVAHAADVAIAAVIQRATVLQPQPAALHDALAVYNGHFEGGLTVTHTWNRVLAATVVA
ncbi:hypothetical protein SISSUDRAFT_875159 [Sistotremastrum suecicum HHB10207 ss-3]|uniref:Uncharacterized protein n=1 Tax=Sistotremastrum suecicum HHB10207 ss-3 TaxID=1314776 RepID=A0A166CAQ1_9AGAM|nr:hypothetical protein SISSUDRAFT_875159 [Sistotremastrum suecicum HHB10207 ss-3]